MNHCIIELEPFHPAFGLENPHAQTLRGNFRSQQGVTFRRVRIDTPDDDFLDLDFADIHGKTWAQLGEDSPIVLVLHGLEGSARRGYMYQTYRELAQRGIRSLGLNFRTCGGDINRKAIAYHSGATYDLACVHDYLDQQFPNAPKAIIGFSLGGNMLLKYLGENGAKLAGRLTASVAVSPPFDLYVTSQRLEQGFNQLYSFRFCRTLVQKTRAKVHLTNGIVDLQQVSRVKTLREFDEVVTAPVHGFRDAMDYYVKNSSAQFISGIAIPTLILRSLDDTFFLPSDIPHEALNHNPHIQTGFVAHGGHVGFVEGNPLNPTYWAERQAGRFLQAILKTGQA